LLFRQPRFLFNIAGLQAEPTGALGLAALLARPERFRGLTVCCVASGGNVAAPPGNSQSSQMT
jgi:threonine dehydratase